MMVIVAILCLAMEKHPAWIKPALIGLGLSCILVAAASNRPFYHIFFSYMDPLGGSGWHRAKLIDLAIEHLGEWWLIGYGGRDPDWGGELGMGITDITNQYLVAGVEYGILGVIMLCGVLAVALRGIVSLYKRSADRELRSLCWSFGSMVVSVAVVWTSVSFFGPPTQLFYSILGMIGSLPNLAGSEFSSATKVNDSVRYAEFLSCR
jgi:hypothetical protein